jgi:hypothetical protein
MRITRDTHSPARKRFQRVRGRGRPATKVDGAGDDADDIAASAPRRLPLRFAQCITRTRTPRRCDALADLVDDETH